MFRRIKVREYSGGRSSERPQVLFIDDEVLVVEVMETWLEEDSIFRKRKRVFRVRDTLDRNYRVHYDYETGQWYLKV